VDESTPSSGSCAATPPAPEFYATRPNPGMEALCSPVDLAPDDVDGLASWAEGEGITLTVVGPEVPLAQGMGDCSGSGASLCSAPTASAVRIESSKAYAKQLMARSGVPTADHRTFTKWPAAEVYLREKGAPIVVKASGLAAGKGAVVCMTEVEALNAAREMLAEASFGDAGREIVIEEFMTGEEVSVFGITDGRHVSLLLPSQDHKRVGEGDTGPNTGGMGAYAPVPGLDATFLDDVRQQVFLPVLEALEASAAPFRGLLYAGLMRKMQPPRKVPSSERYPCIPPPPKPATSPAAYTPGSGSPLGPHDAPVEVGLEPTEGLAGQQVELDADQRTGRRVEQAVQRRDPHHPCPRGSCGCRASPRSAGPW
jgi:phosphoribosylamine---glycine ligase